MPEFVAMESNDQSAPIKATIGIIYPPPEVRNIVDKTASFVARNGPEFESRIRQNEINNPKFNFLVPNDPYNAYYVHKVKEFKEGKALEPAVPKIGGLQSLAKPVPEPVKIPEPVVPTEPPPEFEFVADPPSIATFDLDVVKLTAQFVARNGRQFLTNLMNREQRNYQFDFLRPQHSLFNYFTKLVEQYTKILIPPKELALKLKQETENAKEILDQVKYRVDWARYQERERQKEEAAVERERVAYAQIDWHDFVVVETVDFVQHESGNLPPPTTPDEVGARLIAQERFEAADDIEMEVVSGGEEEEEADQDEEEEEEVQAPPPPPPVPAPPPLPIETPVTIHETPHQPPPLPPMPENVIVRKDYDPKAAKNLMPGGDSYLISPITGERIPANKIAEHVRIGLLDPKWIEQRDRSITEKRGQEEVFAPGVAIAGSLRQLSERRTDIFGVGMEETQIGKKIGEEETKKIDKVTWDGHTASMEKVSQRARENISIEEQIALIHKVKGLVPDQDKEKIGPALPGSSGHPRQVKPLMPPQPKRLEPPPKPLQPPVSQPVVPAVSMTPQPVMVMPGPPMAMRPPSLMSMPTPVPAMPMAAPIMPARPMPVAMAPLAQPMEEEEPPSKKARSEETLVPEEQWAARFPGPVTIQVMTPNMPEKTDYKLTGQTMIFTLPITDSVSVIKAKLHEELGMPAGKQKLSYDGIFMKDANTLAYYNLIRGAAVQLQLKERGGRKK